MEGITILERLDVTAPSVPTCRCCGNNLGLERFLDNHPIHTRCIPKHWGKHSKGVNASRCKEFKSEHGKLGPSNAEVNKRVGYNLLQEGTIMLRDDLKELKALFLTLEDVFWRFKNMDYPDEHDETEVGQEYIRIHETMDDLIGHAQF